MKSTLPWLNAEMVRFHMRKLEKGKNAFTTLPPPPPADGTDLSLMNDSDMSLLTSNSASQDGSGHVLRTEELSFLLMVVGQMEVLLKIILQQWKTPISMFLAGVRKAAPNVVFATSTMGYNLRSPRLPKLTEGHLEN
jgi:hypothetical protein